MKQVLLYFISIIYYYSYYNIYLINVYQKIGKEDKNKRIILSASDTLIWQSFASVIIPGLVINRICAGVRFMQKNAKSPVMRNPWVSTIVGLISIPLIIRPIDDGVERTMDSTYRQWTGYHPQKEMDDKQLITRFVKLVETIRKCVVQIINNSITKFGHSKVIVMSHFTAIVYIPHYVNFIK